MRTDSEFSAIDSERVQILLRGLEEGRGLYLGDNLEWMRLLRKLRPEGCIDLCYIDPPFNSKRNYNAVFKGASQVDESLQKQVFTDTWSHVGYKDEMEALRSEFGQENLYKYLAWVELIYDRNIGMVSYLSTMALRICYIHALLKKTGSFYLHCDPTMSHYLKHVCDVVFGYQNFRNEIAWCYSSPSNVKKHFPRKHDTILFYAKTSHANFYKDEVRIPYKEEHFTMGSPKSLAKQGKGGDYKAGREEYLAKGKVVEDFWIDIRALSVSKERKGYPTQKPQALLARIIKACTHEGDLVVDFFAGCGTTVNTCEALNRKWLAFDIQSIAIALMQEDLRLHYGQDKVVLGGMPKTAEQLRVMSQEIGRYAMQEYIVEGKMSGICNKKGPDGGWDGRRYLNIGGHRIEQLIEVKTGKVSLPDIERAIGVAERRDCPVVVVAFAKEFSPNMQALARGKGAYIYGKVKYDTRIPRCNLLSIEDLYADKDLQAALVSTFFSRSEAISAAAPELGFGKAD